MRVVVTGGAGFLGTALTRELVDAGIEVRVLDRGVPPAWFPEAGVEFAAGDVRDIDAVHRAVAGADAVVHAAFAPPRAGLGTMHEVNVGGIENVCAAVRHAGAGRLVVISSTIVTKPGRPAGPLRRSPLARLNAYRASRAAAEDVAARFGEGPVEVAVVRPKTFVGPGRVGAFALVFDTVRRGGVVLLPGPGTNRYQLVDTRDLAAGLRLLALQGGRGVFTFGATRFGTVADDLGALLARAGTAARLQSLPRTVVRAGLRGTELAGVAPLSEWYQCAARGEDSVVDVERAVDELGWRPIRSNVESLVDAYDWYAERRAAGADAPSTHPLPRGHRLMSAAVRSVMR